MKEHETYKFTPVSNRREPKNSQILFLHSSFGWLCAAILLLDIAFQLSLQGRRKLNFHTILVKKHKSKETQLQYSLDSIPAQMAASFPYECIYKYIIIGKLGNMYIEARKARVYVLKSSNADFGSD